MQPIPFHTVQELEQYLQTQYGAAAIEPVDYLLYNARQQLLNLFYPEVVGQLAALCGYTPDASEEVTALLDELLVQYDSQTLQSDYAQYRFVRTAPQGTRAVFYVTVERNTGFVLPQYEWEEEPAELTQEDAADLNGVLKDILLYQGASESDIRQETDRWQRYKVMKEYEQEDGEHKCVLLSTASPYKFAPAVYEAIFGKEELDEFTCMEKLQQKSGAEMPRPLAELAKLEVRHKHLIDKDEMTSFVERIGKEMFHD